MYIDLNQQNELPSDTEKSPKSVTELLAVAVTAIGAVAAFIYVALHYGGRAFRDSFLAGYGFDSSVMPWSSDDLAYLEFVSDTQHHFLILIGVGSGALLSSLPMLLGRWLKLRRDEGRLYPRRKYGSAQKGAERNLVTGDSLFLLMLGVFAFGLVTPLMAALTFLSLADGAGQSRAEHELTIIRNWDVTAMKSQRFNFVQVVRSVSGAPPTTVSGFLVSCSEKFCGVYSPIGPVHANIVPLDNIVSWKTFSADDVPQELIPQRHGMRNGST